MLVIGIGNELRGDDAAGLLAARRVRERLAGRDVAVRELEGDPSALLAAWEGADAVVVLDTMRSGAAAGTVRRFDAAAQPLPAELTGSTSTHALGLAEAVELARALGRLPARLVVLAIEGTGFAAGAALTDGVREGLERLVEAAVAECSAQ